MLLILADDLGSGDPRCYNPDSGIAPPNIDRIAVGGMRFTDEHFPSSACTPTRYVLITGRNCWRSSLKRGVLWGDSPLLIDPDRLTIPSMLRGHGYDTKGIVKWHLGLGDSPETDYGRP